jgi:hypothetical protein
MGINIMRKYNELCDYDKGIYTVREEINRRIRLLDNEIERDGITAHKNGHGWGYLVIKNICNKLLDISTLGEIE